MSSVRRNKCFNGSPCGSESEAPVPFFNPDCNAINRLAKSSNLRSRGLATKTRRRSSVIVRVSTTGGGIH